MTRRSFLVALLFLAVIVAPAMAVDLSTGQIATLKADREANLPALNDVDAAAAYNLPASPDFWAWRTFVPDSEMYEATSVDATTWSWTIYIARSQAEREAWRQMVNMKGGIDASLPNTRNGIADIFSGAGGLAQRTHLLAISRRKATRAEKLFATGTGSTGSPGVMTVEGVITPTNINQTR